MNNPPQTNNPLQLRTIPVILWQKARIFSYTSRFTITTVQRHIQSRKFKDHRSCGKLLYNIPILYTVRSQVKIPLMPLC